MQIDKHVILFVVMVHIKVVSICLQDNKNNCIIVLLLSIFSKLYYCHYLYYQLLLSLHYHYNHLPDRA